MDNYSPQSGMISGPEEDAIDLREALGYTWAMRFWVGLIAAVITAGAALYAYIAEPVYQSQAMLLVEPDKKAGGAGFDVGSAVLAPSYNVPAEMEILRSRSVAQATIKKLGLSISAEPKYVPLIGNFFARRHEETSEDLALPLMNLTGYAWGGERITVSSLEVPRALLGSDLTLVAGPDKTFQLFDGDAVIAQGAVGSFAPIEIGKARITATAEPHGILVSELVARAGTEFNVRKGPPTSLEDELRESIGAKEKARGSGVMEVSIAAKTPQQAQETLRVIIDSYVEQNVDRKSEEAVKTLDFLQKQIPEFRADLSSKERRLAELRSKTGLINPVDSTADRESEIRARTQVELLRLERSTLASRYEPGFSGFAVLDDKIKMMEGEIAKYQRAYSGLPKRELELIQAARDVEVGKQILLALLNKIEELKVAKAGSVSSVRLIDDASFSREPIAPKRLRVLAIGLALGLLAGVATVWLFRLLLGGIKSPAEVEAALRASVLATVIHSPKQEAIVQRLALGEAVAPLAVESPADMSIEAIRSLRTSLLFSLSEKQNNRVLISGPIPKMGKTFVSVNLGVVMSEIGKRVVVIDCDLRRGALHEAFGEKRGVGLSEVLLGQATLDQALRKEPKSGLTFITGGKLPPNPTDLLSSEAFHRLLDELSASFDVVIVDSAPILSVTDAAIIAPLCDTALMVIKQHELNRPDLENARRRFEQVGAKITGAVINDMPARGRGYNHYYYYAYQGYYKRYEQRYLEPEDKNQPRWKRILAKLLD